MHIDGVNAVSSDAGESQIDSDKKALGSRRMMDRRRRMMQQQAQGRRRDNSGQGMASAEHLISFMDAYGVEKSIVMPPPQGKNQKGSYTYKALLGIIEKYPNRLVLGAGGGTLNVMIQETPPDKVTEDVRRRFSSVAEQIVRAGAHVFGEMTALHTCMNPKHHYVVAPPDHPLFLLLADLAAKYDIPIDLHMEALTQDQETPEELLECCDKNPSHLTATIPAFRRLLAHNRSARIVWQHIGWDNLGQMTPELLGTLLKENSNLYLAIKAVPDPNRKNKIHDDNFEILPEWIELFREFQDRIVVGSDEFARSPKMSGGYKKPHFFEITWKTVASLPSELREKIGRDNAIRIYRLR